MPDSHLIYWDASVFLSYINNIPDRVNTIQAIFDAVEKNNKAKIVTSMISKVEVAYTMQEGLNRALNDEEEAKIEALWEDSSIVELVDLHDEISLLARKIMRDCLSNSWKIRPNDAIHLASAKWLNVNEINTYDDKWERCKDIVGISIKQPTTDQPKLFLMD